jgi:hypothetical protein
MNKLLDYLLYIPNPVVLIRNIFVYLYVGVINACIESYNLHKEFIER